MNVLDQNRWHNPLWTMSSFGATKLDTRGLTAAVNDAVTTDATLGAESKQLIAKLYTLFRHRIGPAFTNGDASDVFFWTEVIADMMVTAGKFRADGVQKKAALIAALHIVIDNEVPPTSRDAAKTIVNVAVSPAIDLAIMFANKAKGCKGCKWGCC